MSLSLFLRKTVVCGCLSWAAASVSFGQANYTPNGGEYPIAPSLVGDQVRPRLSVGAGGGFIVWQDNITDGEGIGISAMQLDRGLSGTLSPFRVNQTATDDQERPQVALLKDGGAVFVWQGGRLGFQHIYARFLSPSNTWITASDILVNTSTNYQVDPVVTRLANGNVVVVWSSFDQQGPNSMRDVYGQVFSPTGQKIGQEFPINQFASFNQRTPAIAALSNGAFVVVWVSEQQRGGNIDNSNPNHVYSGVTTPSVDIFARLYNAGGVPVANEFLVNVSSNVCANPAVAASADGGFMVAWMERDTVVRLNGWDIFARPFSSSGAGSAVRQINAGNYGDQFGAQIAAIGGDFLVTWTSLGQDGSMEGVYGRFLSKDGSQVGDEFRVNSTTISKQMHPAAASDGEGRALVAWTSYAFGGRGFDLFAQRYGVEAQPIDPMDAPFVHVPFVVNSGAYQPELQVSWPIQGGLAVDRYLVYIDGAAEPVASISTNIWTMTASDGLKANTTYSVRVAYVTTDGRRSALSEPATAKTWGGLSWGGIPFEWMTASYGSDVSTWPSAGTLLMPGSPTLLQVFLSGGIPQDPSTWLKTKLESTPQGFFLKWNSQPGLMYQVQASTDVSTWTDVGGPRFAAGAQDSIFVGYGSSSYYRVVRLR